MIDRNVIGKLTPTFAYQLVKEKIAEYADAIGETNPLYYDEEKAKAAGYPSIIAPPTALTIVAMKANGAVDKRGVDYSKLLHGEQEYEFFRPMNAGETVLAQGKISDIYEKANKDFINVEVELTSEQGELIAISRMTLVVGR